LKVKSIQDFTAELYELAKKGQSIVLGEKGRDNYLRDYGYFDRIPMDRHEMRFILRTGIYTCCPPNESDPLNKKHLQRGLADFCGTYLKGKRIQGIDLGEAPGIVDFFIWYYCSREGYNICGNIPKCKKCDLNGSCFYALSRKEL
jgi:hypothetical protein